MQIWANVLNFVPFLSFFITELSICSYVLSKSEARCSYKLCSYKKKRVYVKLWDKKDKSFMFLRGLIWSRHQARSWIDLLLFTLCFFGSDIQSIFFAANNFPRTFVPLVFALSFVCQTIDTMRYELDNWLRVVLFWPLRFSFSPREGELSVCIALRAMTPMLPFHVPRVVPSYGALRLWRHTKDSNIFISGSHTFFSKSDRFLLAI